MVGIRKMVAQMYDTICPVYIKIVVGIVQNIIGRRFKLPKKVMPNRDLVDFDFPILPVGI